MSENLAIHHAEQIATVMRTTANPSLIDANIAYSWVRCRDRYGIDPAQPHNTEVVDHHRLLEHKERLNELLEIASFEMNNLYQQISGSGFVILLTDHNGVIIDSIADPALTGLFRRAGLWNGAVWSENQEGTNAIGTCLMEKRPLIVHRNEHFRFCNTQLTCSAAPIFDSGSNLLAVLDASAVNSPDSKQSQLHTLALATLSAKLIENCHFLRRFRNDWVLRFHSQPEYVGLLSAGMLAFNGAGSILASNQSALNQLDYQHRQQLIEKTIDTVFDIRLDDLLGRACRQPNTLWPIYDRCGNRHFAMLRGPERYSAAKRAPIIVEPARTPLPMTLAGLQGGDPNMIYNVRCALRVMNKDINILLNGETGAGKEAFARAIHAASARAAKPFVAVNCASIPDNLIESELFGYKYGAFTGARREGLRGKILQASGGTLFLDEIGDMPAQLQTRLLRVLEDKEVLPLGSETPIPVNIHIISATHCNLAQRVAADEFRKDLYYRLNGLTLTLPSLRERADLSQLIRSFLAAESEGVPVRISEDAFAALLNYSWPGNIRQLRNVLRTAVALCEDDIIQTQDLPAEIAQVTAASIVQPINTASSPPQREVEDLLACSEKETLLRVLERHRWHISNASAYLGLSRNTLYRKMKKHGIKTLNQD